MKQKIGIILVFVSTLLWLSVFFVPWFIESNKVFVAGALYSSSYVFLLLAVPFVGKEWMDNMKEKVLDFLKKIRSSKKVE